MDLARYVVDAIVPRSKAARTVANKSSAMPSCVGKKFLARQPKAATIAQLQA